VAGIVEMNMPLEESISVIICTYNGAEKILNCLKALDIQSAASSFKVTVIVDGSTDETELLLEQVRNKFSFPLSIIVNKVNLGISASKNKGINSTEGEFVVFTDDDCLPPPNWIRSIKEIWNQQPQSVKAIGGYVVADKVETLNQRFANQLRVLSPFSLSYTSQNFFIRFQNYYSQPPAISGPGLSVVGANMSFRRAALIDVGLFNELITFGGEETELSARFINLFGETAIHLSSQMLMRHSFDRSYRDSLRRAKAYGFGSASFLRKKGNQTLPAPTPHILFLLYTIVFTGHLLITESMPMANLFALLITTGTLFLLYMRKANVGIFKLFKNLDLAFYFLAVEVMNNIGFFRGIWTKR
jgi:glycosyltransferase involved in cell wall biosynthesis